MVLSQKGITPGNSFLESLRRKFDGNESNFVLGNAEVCRSFPIVYCSDGFCQLTGYLREELMGKSCECNFLYGLDTDINKIRNWKNALNLSKELRTEIRLHRKDGSSFLCWLDVIPIRNENNDIVLYLVSHKEILHNPQATKDTRVSENKVSVPRVRKFSRDVLFYLQRQYSGSQQQQSTRRTSGVGTESQFIPEYKLENTKLPRFMLLHFGRTRLLWDWFILLLVAYLAITVPYTAAFGNVKTYLVLIDLSFEFFFACDIVINFRTTYIESQSARLITNPKEIANNYLQRWFIVDCVATIPFELLYFVNDWFASHLQYFKICRLFRLFRILRRVNRYTEYTTTLLILMMFSFALLAHWFACIWYVIGNVELHRGTNTGWLHTLSNERGTSYHNATNLSSSEKYVSALYFVFTSLTTVGFGNIAPNTVSEQTFSILVLLVGAMVQSAIFGNMTAVIQKLYAARARFHAKASEIKQFVRHHQIDGELRRRIEDWFISHWSISKGVNTEEMLMSFPSELQADISLHLYRSFLTLPCFKHASRGCLRSISLKVKKAYFSPGELVIKEKDAINALFFVQRGTIEIVQRDFIVAILGGGDLFGEDISRTSSSRRSNGDVRALMYCDILYLTRDNIKEVLEQYPEFGDIFSQNIGLSFDLSAGRSRTSTYLKSIVEESEHHSEQSYSDSHHSTDEDSDNGTNIITSRNNTKFSFTKKRSRTRNSNHVKIPLWQQQIQNQEVQVNVSPARSPKNRMMCESPASCSDEQARNAKMKSPLRKLRGESETSFSENFMFCSQATSNKGSQSDCIASINQKNSLCERTENSKPLRHYNKCEKIRESVDYLLNATENGHTLLKSTRDESDERTYRKTSSRSLPEMASADSTTINSKRSVDETFENSLQKICKLYNGTTYNYLSVPTTSINENKLQAIDQHSSSENSFLDVDHETYQRSSSVDSYEFYQRENDTAASTNVHYSEKSKNQTNNTFDNKLINFYFDKDIVEDNNNNTHKSNTVKNCNQMTSIDSDKIKTKHLPSTSLLYPVNANEFSVLSEINEGTHLTEQAIEDNVWSQLANQLINLKQGDVQEMKNDMQQLRHEIQTIKQGMESLTELVKLAFQNDQNKQT